MKIPKDTRLFLSTIGTKGFHYPSKECITSTRFMDAEEKPWIYPVDSGLTPYQVETDNAGINRATIYWVDKTALLRAQRPK